MINNINTVAKLNKEIGESFPDHMSCNCFLVFQTIADEDNQQIIKFMGAEIWKSWDNDMKFDKSKNKYESLETYLRREIRDLMVNVHNFNKNWNWRGRKSK